MGNQACARPCALYKLCIAIHKSGAFDVDEFELSSTNLSETAQEKESELERYIDALTQVIAAQDADPAKRKAIFNKAVRGTHVDIERATERKLFLEMLDFQQRVDSFKRTRRRIINTFMMSVAISPCHGRRFKRLRVFGLSKYEVCQAPETKEKYLLREIIATNQAFMRDFKVRLRQGEKPADIKNRFFTGEYGL